MQQFDQIASMMPFLIAGVAFFMLLMRYFLLQRIHHLFLALIFLLLAFSFFYIWLFCQKEYEMVACLFPIRQPVKLLLVPACFFCIGTTFLGKRLQTGNVLLHILPAIFVFVGFIPFWFVPKEIQLSYLSEGYTNITNNSIIENVQILREVSVFIIFNALLLIYSLLIIREFRHYKKTHGLSFIAIIGTYTLTVALVFLTFLLVLVDNAYFLGISKFQSSRIIFSLISSVFLLLVFICGFYRKDCNSIEKTEEESEINVISGNHL